MTVNLRVTFDMAFNDAKDGKCVTNVVFALPDYPDMPVGDKIKQLAIQEVEMLCGAVIAKGVFEQNITGQGAGQ
jgi:hypothetical protein